MKRRKTVSVTPAMGASTVAGEISTWPMVTEEGTRALTRRASVGPLVSADGLGGVSQYLRTRLFYVAGGQSQGFAIAAEGFVVGIVFPR